MDEWNKFMLTLPDLYEEKDKYWTILKEKHNINNINDISHISIQQFMNTKIPLVIYTELCYYIKTEISRKYFVAYEGNKKVN